MLRRKKGRKKNRKKERMSASKKINQEQRNERNKVKQNNCLTHNFYNLFMLQREECLKERKKL